MSRPWGISSEIYEMCIKERFPMWLQERGGIVVYENHMMDSSNLGHRSFLPLRYIAEDNQFHDAPARIGDVPSRFEEKVDVITLDEFNGNIEQALACFMADSK